MKLRAALLPFLLLLASLASPAGAHHVCDPSATPTTLGDGFYSVSDGGPAQGYLVSTWLYQESNAVIGLQRGGVALSNGASDPCQEDTPDTLLSGTAIHLGQPLVLAPYPGLVALVAHTGGTLLLNPFGFDCAPPVTSATLVSVTCDAPTSVPFGFQAVCQDLVVGAGFTSVGAGAATGEVSCGGASALCTTPAGSVGWASCTQAAPGTSGTLPVTCKAQNAPGSYLTRVAWCRFG